MTGSQGMAVEKPAHRAAPKSAIFTSVPWAIMMLAGFSSSVLAGDCSPWDAAIGQPGINAAVYSLASLPNGEIIAGGAFTSAGGVPANRIARWDGATWHALGDGMNGLVLSLQVMPNGDVIAAGSFTLAGGEPADRIARWDGTSWHALGDGLNSHVWDLAVLPDGDLFAAIERVRTSPPARASRGLVMVGEYDQALAPWQETVADPTALRRRRAERRMVDEAREWCAQLNAATLPATATFTEIAGEDHASVLPVALSRALRPLAGIRQD